MHPVLITALAAERRRDLAADARRPAPGGPGRLDAWCAGMLRRAADRLDPTPSLPQPAAAVPAGPMRAT